jgi:uncharacterized protein
MSRENVEVVRAAMDAMSARGRDGVADFLEPTIEFEEDARFPEAGTYSGHDEVLRYMGEFTAQFEEYVFTLEDVIDAGQDTILACLHIRGRGKGSSARFDTHAGWICTVRDGRIARVKAYLHRADALEAVGLSE